MTIWQWQNNCGNVTVNVSNICDSANVTMTVWQWQCDSDNVTVPMWQWQYIWHCLHYSMWQGPCDSGNVITGLKGEGNKKIKLALQQFAVIFDGQTETSKCFTRFLTHHIWSHYVTKYEFERKYAKQRVRIQGFADSFLAFNFLLPGYFQC